MPPVRSATIRPRNPKRTEILDLRGNPVGTSRHGFRVRTGRVYVVQVTLPDVEDGDLPIDKVVPLPSGIECSGDPILVKPGDQRIALLIHVPRRISPLPSYARLILVMTQENQTDGGFPTEVTFLVQPTGGILLRWSAVVLGGAGISRMNSHWEKGGSLGDLVDTFAKGEFWTQTITFFGLIAGGIGLVYAWVWASGD